MKQKVFPRNKLKLPDTRSEYIDETWLIVIDNTLLSWDEEKLE